MPLNQAQMNGKSPTFNLKILSSVLYAKSSICNANRPTNHRTFRIVSSNIFPKSMRNPPFFHQDVRPKIVAMIGTDQMTTAAIASFVSVLVIGFCSLSCSSMKNHLDPDISADTTNATGTNHSRNCRNGSRYELIVLCAVPVSNPALTGITEKRKHMVLPLLLVCELITCIQAIDYHWLTAI